MSRVIGDPGAELKNVDGPVAQLDQRAGRAMFAGIVPEAEELRCGLEEQDGNDDGEGKHRGPILNPRCVR
jgi:hypothetical protein